MARNDIITVNNNSFYAPFKDVPSNATLRSFAAEEVVRSGVTPTVSLSSTGVNVSICFGKSIERKVIYEFK